MSALARRHHRGLFASALTALVVCLTLLAPAPAPAADRPGAATSEKASFGKVRGNIFGRANGGPVRVKLLLFRADWSYIGTRRVAGSTYSLSLAEGAYRIQLVDKRPAYDIRKFAPTDALVRVRGGTTTVRNIRMRRGAAITGTVRTGGKAGARARVVAANTSEQSFETIANERGQYALGGLPRGSYSVFTYDRRRTWVGKSSYLPGMRPGRIVNLPIALRRRAGELRVDLYAGGEPLRGSGYATVVSRRTGQFWTARFSGGSIAFPGVFPGRYRIIMPDVGRWFGRSGAVSNGNVRSGRGAFGSFRLTQRGGAFLGRVVLGDPGTPPARDVTVRLYAASGALLSETRTNSQGGFVVGGSLRAQSGLKIVAFNPYSADFEQAVLPGLDIAVNQDEQVGVLTMERKVAPPAQP